MDVMSTWEKAITATDGVEQPEATVTRFKRYFTEAGYLKPLDAVSIVKENLVDWAKPLACDRCCACGWPCVLRRDHPPVTEEDAHMCCRFPHCCRRHLACWQLHCTSGTGGAFDTVEAQAS